jgi:hypothetical protein
MHELTKFSPACVQTLSGSIMSIDVSDQGDLIASSGHMNSPNTSLLCWKHHTSNTAASKQKFQAMDPGVSATTVEVGQKQKLVGHSSWVNCCSISKDGLTMLSGSHDGTVKIWDMSPAGVCTCLRTVDCSRMQTVAEPLAAPVYKSEGSTYRSIQNFAHHGVNWCTLAANGHRLVLQRHRGRVLTITPARCTPTTAHENVMVQRAHEEAGVAEVQQEEPQGVISLALLYASGNWRTATA